MKETTMIDYLALIDTQTGGNRCDVTPIFADISAFNQLITDIVEPFQEQPFDYVAGIDALGFILGTAVALRIQKGFIPIRKGGKLPGSAQCVSFVDYTNQEKSLELRAQAFPSGSKILLIDEWIETGAQVRAAIALLEGQGDIIIGIATINMDENEQTYKLQNRYRCHTVSGNG